MRCNNCNEPWSVLDYQAAQVYSCPDECDERAALCSRCAPGFPGFRCQRNHHQLRNVHGISTEDLARGMSMPDEPQASEDSGSEGWEWSWATRADSPGNDASAWVCIVCDEGKSRSDTVFCPGTTDDNCLRMIVCTSCRAAYAGQDIRCYHCSGRLVDEQGVEVVNLPEGERTLIGMTDPPPGCEQAGMQCYAAAAATACNWTAGTAMTADEAMHLYLMSEHAAGEAAEIYPPAFSDAQERMWPDASVAEVQAEMLRDAGGEIAMLTAVRGLGVPVFPEAVPHVYLPEMTQDHFKEALADNCVIMIASSSHWEVVYACEVDPDGKIFWLRSFCPASGFSAGTWRGGYEGYVVGRSHM